MIFYLKQTTVSTANYQSTISSHTYHQVVKEKKMKNKNLHYIVYNSKGVEQ